MDTGDTAWLLMSTALVMIMLPGLALFYGGLVRRKNVLSTIIVKVVDVILGIRVTSKSEEMGLDLAVHGEAACQS